MAVVGFPSYLPLTHRPHPISKALQGAPRPSGSPHKDGRKYLLSFLVVDAGGWVILAGWLAANTPPPYSPPSVSCPFPKPSPPVFW